MIYSWGIIWQRYLREQSRRSHPFKLDRYSDIGSFDLGLDQMGYPQQKSLYPILSLVGFTLATLSGLLAVFSMLYAVLNGGFPYYDARLLRIYGWGGVLPIAGLPCAIAGARQSGALRWQALGSSLGMLLFWFMSAKGDKGCKIVR